MTGTTHDLTVAERYTQEYIEPDSHTPRSTGYVNHDNYAHLTKKSVSVDDVVRFLSEHRNSITAAQLAEIRKVLAG
jgi:hypothetical protein